jgi:hypothetical protein
MGTGGASARGHPLPAPDSMTLKPRLAIVGALLAAVQDGRASVRSQRGGLRPHRGAIRGPQGAAALTPRR